MGEGASGLGATIESLRKREKNNIYIGVMGFGLVPDLEFLTCHWIDHGISSDIIDLRPDFVAGGNQKAFGDPSETIAKG
jgi:hypothetical protein